VSRRKPSEAEKRASSRQGSPFAARVTRSSNALSVGLLTAVQGTAARPGEKRGAKPQDMKRTLRIPQLRKGESLEHRKVETAIKGSPRDMKKWLELLLDPNIQFPGESSEYRRARNQLLESERELRRMNQQVAAQRRALPPGGVLPGYYVFESAADGSQVRFSELFAPG